MHRSTLDKTELLLLNCSLNNSPLDFSPLVLVESFIVELEVVHLVVYHLAHVLRVVCLGTSKRLGVGMFDKRLNVRILYVCVRIIFIYYQRIDALLWFNRFISCYRHQRSLGSSTTQYKTKLAPKTAISSPGAL